MAVKRVTLVTIAILLCFLSAHASEKIVKESFVQLERKRAESVGTMREYAELLLSDQPYNTITIKRNEAVLKAERLQQEADELEQQCAVKSARPIMPRPTISGGKGLHKKCLAPVPR